MVVLFGHHYLWVLLGGHVVVLVGCCVGFRVALYEGDVVCYVLVGVGCSLC